MTDPESSGKCKQKQPGPTPESSSEAGKLPDLDNDTVVGLPKRPESVRKGVAGLCNDTQVLPLDQSGEEEDGPDS
ncbi:MAG: hypothetical protein ACYTGH_14460 [Planctomycetota bacterium]|jgi:hypothetical protein